jgi:hypothetical protein
MAASTTSNLAQQALAEVQGGNSQNASASNAAAQAAQALQEVESPSAPTKPTASAPPAAPSAPLDYSARFRQGLSDLPAGAAQLVEHTPVLNTVTNGWRMLIQQGLKAIGAKETAQFFSPMNTGQFDQRIQQREQEYQDARKAANQTGIDWWRLGGNLANPLNYLGAGAAESAGARVTQAAAQGGAIAGLQPTETTPSDFWWDKAKSVLSGAATGGALAGTVEAASPVLKLAVQGIKKVMGKNTSAAAPAADTVVSDALKAKGIDPNSVDLNLLSGMKQEVQTALEHGADISPAAIVNRTKAEALPVPVYLMRGQATGDPMLFAREQNLKGVQGVGELITQRLQGQNQAFIDNLDALGAKDAPDTVSMGHQLNDAVQGQWDQMQAHKEALYDAVKNSKGQAATLDGKAAGAQVRSVLGAPEAFHAWMTLPAHIQKTVYDLEEGKLPLTVSNWQALDKSWGADARAADGSTSHAINLAREIMSNAPIADDAGVEARQAYQAAKQAHSQQMSLINPKLLNGRPNPNYQPLMKAVVMDGKPVESLFTTHFLNAAPSQAEKNLQFMSKINPQMPQALGKTFMGAIKQQALSSASDERGAVSEAVLRGWARDPVKSARLAAMMPDPAVQTFKNLADVVEAAKKPPVAATINYSGTAPTMMNMAMNAAKSNIGLQILSRVLRIHGGIIEPAVQGEKAALQAAELQSTLNPGVTLKSLLSTTAKQAARNRAVSRVVVPAAIAAKQGSNSSENH